MMMEIDRLHYLGVLSLMSQATPYIPEDLRDSVTMALQDSPIVTGASRRVNRIDFETDRGGSSFEHGPDDVKRVGNNDG